LVSIIRIVTLHVQNFHRCLQSIIYIAVVFHSVVNGFLRQGRPNQLKCIYKLGNCF